MVEDPAVSGNGAEVDREGRVGEAREWSNAEINPFKWMPSVKF